MTTYNLYGDITEEFTFPVTPDVGTVDAVVYYEWGEIIADDIDPVIDTGTTYTLSIPGDIMSACGSYRIKWSCEVSTAPRYFYTTFDVDEQYILEAAFMADYPEFDTVEYQGALYNKAELMSRKIIDTFCGQSFHQIIDREMRLDGNGHTKLFLPERIFSLNTVSFIVDSEETDYSEYVEVDNSSHHWLKTNSSIKFPSNGVVVIDGDWGWLSPPKNIAEASKLLIADLLDETRREHHRYGIARLWQDTNRLEFISDIYQTSTGNIDVDVLLMDYIFWTPTYV